MAAASFHGHHAGAGVGDYVVPNYDIYGHHHAQKPYKDKSRYVQKEVRHPKWLDEPPPIKSRSELQQARKQGRVPDPRSYDFDGDGVVGQMDYFIGKSFDGDADGRLTTGERRRAEKALENGFMDKYMRGLDSTGQASRNAGGIKISQVRGVICGADNPQEASVATYGKHFNSHKVPEHYTRTALNLHRTAEAKGAGLKAGEIWAARCEPVVERSPDNHETVPRVCDFSHIRERAEADHQLARVRGGLQPMNQPVNPEREFKTVGLNRVEQPVYHTRGQLLETRREAMKRECEDLRSKGDELNVPLSVRRSAQEAQEFEFRRPREEPMTMTRMKDDRRRNKIEYDMHHFGAQRVAPREYPKFSDHPDIPFWVSDPGDARIGSSPPPVIPRSVSEPNFKVTEVPWGEQPRQTMETLPDSAHTLSAAGRSAGNKATYGSKTKKRWSADMLERGQGRNQPRLFDSIKPVRLGPKDLENLDLTSSMEPVRSNALRQQAEDRRVNASVPKRSQLYSDPSESLAPTNGGAHYMGPMASKGQSQVESADAVALGSMQRSATEPAPAPAAAPPPGGTRPGVRRPLVTAVMGSEPMPRAPPPVMENMTKPKEPRFFGTGTVRGMPQSFANVETGVRSGGFQRLDASMTGIAKSAMSKTRGQQSKERPTSRPKEEA